MTQKIRKNLLLMFLCVIVILGFRSSTVQAAMADLATEYEIGTEYTGYVNGIYGQDTEEFGARYFRFNIIEKSHVTLYCWYKDSGYGGTIYNSSGKSVLKVQDLKFQTNQATGWSKAKLSRELSAGTYYLKIDDNGGRGVQSFDFKFVIQAENRSNFPRAHLNL